MNKGWFKKVSLVLMLALTLGTVACSEGQDFEDEETVENFVDGQNQNAGNDDEGSVTCFGDSGCITSTDDFVSVNTGFDGPTFASDF